MVNAFVDRPSLARRPLLACALWAVSLLGLGLLLAVPRPLLINLGAGDEPFARGFRSGWERDGLRQTGHTMFRWTLDGSRLVLPLSAGPGPVTARLRLARFAASSAEVTLLAGDRVAQRWRQPPRGWKLQEVSLPAAGGPLALGFRSVSDDGDPLGVALDWVELHGVGLLRPQPHVWKGLLALLLGVPLLAGLLAQRLAAAAWTGLALAALAAAAVGLDRLGGLLALAQAGPLALVVLPLLGLAALGLGRAWPEHLRPWRRAAVVPAALALVALVALSHPFFYYPDVDTHARFLAAARADPSLLLDAREYQVRTGAWTREVAGRRLAFPYSPVFYVLAWPLAPVFGEVAAVKAVGVLGAALSVLLAHAMARALGLGLAAARLAQLLGALLPVCSSRLTLALYPALLGQAAEAALLVHLMRRSMHLDGARDGAAAFAMLLLAQSVYTGSILNVAAVVAVLAPWQAAGGEWRRALRLLGAWALALGLTLALFYVRFLPTLAREVLPYLRAVPGEAPQAVGAASLLDLAAARAAVFYGAVYPGLAVLGVVALRGAPLHARRVLGSALLAGLGLLLLRFTLPALFRDAKEVELLALPVAVCSAAALQALWARRTAPVVSAALRALAVAAALGLASWGAWRAMEAYASRFLAAGR